MSVRRGDAIPLYHQIYLALRDSILKGEIAHGASMPTEQELGDRFNVSRITARRALNELASSGLVERRRRIGTRVVHERADNPIEANIEQAVESLIAFGRDTQVRHAEVSTEQASGPVAAKLGLEPGEQVIRAVRIRERDGAPLGEIVSYLPQRTNICLTAEDLRHQPILEIIGAAGITISGAHQTIEAGLADAQLSEVLGIPMRDPILSVERLVSDSTQRPLLLTVARYRADRYKITLDLGDVNRLGNA